MGIMSNFTEQLESSYLNICESWATDLDQVQRFKTYIIGMKCVESQGNISLAWIIYHLNLMLIYITKSEQYQNYIFWNKCPPLNEN